MQISNNKPFYSFSETPIYFNHRLPFSTRLTIFLRQFSTIWDTLVVDVVEIAQIQKWLITQKCPEMAKKWPTMAEKCPKQKGIPLDGLQKTHSKTRSSHLWLFLAENGQKNNPKNAKMPKIAPKHLKWTKSPNAPPRTKQNMLNMWNIHFSLKKKNKYALKWKAMNTCPEYPLILPPPPAAQHGRGLGERHHETLCTQGQENLRMPTGQR